MQITQVYYTFLTIFSLKQIFWNVGFNQIKRPQRKENIDAWSVRTGFEITDTVGDWRSFRWRVSMKKNGFGVYSVVTL